MSSVILNAMKFMFNPESPEARTASLNCYIVPLFYTLSSEYHPDFEMQLVYPISEVRSGSVGLLCSFTQLPDVKGKVSNDAEPNTAFIRAVASNATESEIEPIIVVPQVQVIFDPHSRFSIVNQGGVNYYYVPMLFDFSKYVSGSEILFSGSYKIVWQWSYVVQGKPDGQWFQMNQPIGFTFNFIPAAPLLPWQTGPNGYVSGPSTSLPWAGFYHFICGQLNGLMDIKSVLGQMVQLPNDVLNLQYSVSDNYSSCQNKPDAAGLELPDKVEFFGMPFLELIQGTMGHGPEVNCTDMATYMYLFARLLGIPVDVYRIQLPHCQTNYFTTNPVYTLGNFSGTANTETFKYHDFAVIISGLTPIVFDPCLRFEQNKPVAGIALPEYLKQLVSSGDFGKLTVTEYSGGCEYLVR